MEQLFTGVATFLLESAASLGIDKGAQSLTDHLSNKALLNADENVRDYLMSHLADFDYEKIDSFLARNGIYAHDQATMNWSIMSAQTENIINDFYTAHPILRYEAKNLTPILKQAIEGAYQAVISQLGTDARILYQQAVQHRTQNTNEHKQIQDQIKDISAQLAQLTRKLPYSEVIRVYNILFSSIRSGSFDSIDTLITLMENQVEDRDRCYCTALRIYLSILIGPPKDTETLCAQFVRENPSQSLIFEVVTFFFQFDARETLKIIHPVILEPILAAIVLDWVSGSLSNAIKHLTNSSGALKEEYAATEYALWLYAKHTQTVGNKISALKTYTEIEHLYPTIWAKWSLTEIKAQLLLTDSLTNTTVDLQKAKQQVAHIFSFSGFFAPLQETLCFHFIDTLLNCASILPIDEFDTYYEKLPLRMKTWSRTRGHWYAAHLLKNDNINSDELRSFCDETGDKILWINYLYRRVTDSPEYVIRCIEEDIDILQNEFAAFVAYYEALSAVKGEEAAYNTITQISVPETEIFSYNVFLAECGINLGKENANVYLQRAVDESLSPSGDIPIVHLRALIILLVHSKRWEDAAHILSQYQDKDPSLMMLRLKVLIEHDDQFETCTDLIRSLEPFYENSSYLAYCKGMVAEHELSGSGMEFFEDAFHVSPCPQYAHNVLTSRINRKIFIEDEILSYAAGHDNVDLLHICGITYARYGRHRQSYTFFLQALINCGERYHESLYSVFTGQQLGTPEHDTSPEIVEPGECCILRHNESGQLKKIWVHDDTIKIPVHGSSFAGYDHISPNTQIAFLLLGQSLGDTVTFSDGEYEVVAINYGDVIATQYCMKLLLDHGVFKQICVDKNDLSSFFAELQKTDASRSEHIQDVLDKYRACDPGLTLQLFAKAVSKPYYKAMYALTYDPNIPFWAGTDGYIIDRACILTPSVIAVLSSLEIHPPAIKDNDIKVYVPNALKSELGLQSQEHRSDRTAAVLGFAQDGHPYMIENTAESKRSANLFFGYLNEWASWAITLPPVSPQEYPSNIKGIADAIGIPDIEAMVAAQKLDCLICCDDLMLRRYMSYVGNSTATTVDILLYLKYPYETVLDAVGKLLERKYIYPITSNFLCWVSNHFENAHSETELEQYALPFVDIIKKALSIAESRTYLIHVYQKLVSDKVRIHPTLSWIMTMSFLDHFRSPELSENEIT